MDQKADCIFCINEVSATDNATAHEQIIKGYKYWWLLLQPKVKRSKTKQAAGLLVTKRHIEAVSLATNEEAAELIRIIKDAAKSLCEAVGTMYTGQESIGFNQGFEAGQTVQHAHVHVLPVSESDPPELKVRGGIGGAFEALRELRLSKQ